MKVRISNIKTGKNMDYSECRHLPRLGDVMDMGTGVDGEKEYVKVDSISHTIDKCKATLGHYCKAIVIHVKPEVVRKWNYV